MLVIVTWEQSLTHKLGVWALICGGILTLVGLVGGFGLMFAGIDDHAKTFLAFVPLGFLCGFTGIVMTLLGKSD